MIKPFTSFLILIVCCFVIECRKARETDKPVLFLPNDLEATLWAESPLFYNPTNMDVDIKGRIWVTEAVNYRNYNNDSTKFLHHIDGDRVMILEDTNQDGVADKSKVFVEDKDLVSPLGIAVLGKRIFVSCSPHLIVYTDENGDDVPDKKEILLTGFGGKDHDHSLHSVVGGPDGNLYFNTGNAGPHVVKDQSGWMLRSGSIYTGGSPYNKENQGSMKSDDGRIWVGGLALRIKPDGTGLKVMGHNFRNSYEVMVDSYSNLWQNDNDDQVVACRTSWLMEGGNAGYFSSDGTRYWQADQRPWQDIFTAHWHQEDPGIMPAGDKTGAGSPTGVALNEGDGLGEKYRGLLLSADAGRNIIFGFQPSVAHSGYDLGARSNFITSLSNDNEGYVWNDSVQNTDKNKWFRPSDVTIGTDGAIYVADWYDPVVGGHQMQDPSGYGRIYRIAPKNDRLKTPVLELNSMEGMITALKNPAINVRYQAFEKLKEQGNKAIGPVKELLNSSNPYHRARAIWLLSMLGDAGRAELKALLEDKDELTRATTFRAMRQTDSDLLPLAEKLTADVSPFVRREVAIALRDLPFEKTKPLLLKLVAGYDGSDPWYLEAIGAGFAGHEEAVYPEIRKMFKANDLKPDGWDRRLASLTWRLHPASAVTDFANRAGSTALNAKERDEALTALAFVNTRPAAQAMVELTRSPLADVAEKATYWVSFRQSNDWFGLLDWNKTGINTEHERQVAAMSVKKSRVLSEELPFDEKKWSVQAMATDPVGGQMIITMMAEHQLAKEFYPFVEALIFKNPDASVRIQATSYFKTPGAARSFSIEAIAKLKGNAQSGKSLFAGQCATCHRVNNQGGSVGPDLGLIRKKFDRNGLLDAIINPSAAIVFGYEPWLITMDSGESVFGFLVADGKQAVVVKDISGKSHTLETAKIKSRKKQENSLMPEPSSLGLNEQNLADVSEYLMTLP